MSERLQVAGNKKKILVLSGKRGGFGAMRPMLNAMVESEYVELLLCVTDQHLDSSFGETIKEVEKDFEVHSKIHLGAQDGSEVGRAEAMSRFISRFSKELRRVAPDMCVLFGDRSEVLAAAYTCLILNIPIGHIQGGDKSGSIDECMRHAITKLSSFHFVSCEDSRRRVIQLGEREDRVFVVGDCHIDEICEGKFAGEERVRSELGLTEDKPILVLLQHPETTEPLSSYDQMCETLRAVDSMDGQVVAIYPCSDQGFKGTLRAYDEWIPRMTSIRLYKNLDAELFWGLLGCADVLIGNSSCGIVESPSFQLPTVNIGRRQQGRLRALNIISVDHREDEIRSAIDKALYDKDFGAMCKGVQSPYGSGDAGKRIVKALETLHWDSEVVKKEFVDLDA